MSSELAKTISSSVVWLAVAIILTGGLYRMSGGSPEFYGFTTIVIVGGATISTAVIWIPRSKKEEPPAPRGFEVVRPVESVGN
jgi:hypothetical protein